MKLVTIALVFGLCACAAGPPPPETPGPAGNPGDPLYLVQTRLSLPDDRLHHFTPVRSLADSGLLDTTRALEAHGNARLYAEPGSGAFILGQGESATLTRFEVGADGGFQKGATLSFAGLGVKALGFRAVTFVDRARALYRDGGTLQVVEWNPATMSITRSIPLPRELDRPGYTTFTGYGSVRRGEQILFPVMWYRPAVDEVPADVALVTVDLATGQASAARDPRCPAGGIAFSTPDGDTYFFNQLTSTYADAVFMRGRAACALRIRAGATSFDPDYLLEVGPMVAGAPAAAVGWGGGGRLWFRALDRSLYTLPAGADYAEFFAAPAWRLWHLDVTRPAQGAVAAATDPPASCCGLNFVVDDRPYGLALSPEGATLVELGGDAPRPTLSTPGTIDEVVRLR